MIVDRFCYNTVCYATSCYRSTLNHKSEFIATLSLIHVSKSSCNKWQLVYVNKKASTRIQQYVYYSRPDTLNSYLSVVNAHSYLLPARVQHILLLNSRSQPYFFIIFPGLIPNFRPVFIDCHWTTAIRSGNTSCFSALQLKLLLLIWWALREARKNILYLIILELVKRVIYLEEQQTRKNSFFVNICSQLFIHRNWKLFRE